MKSKDDRFGISVDLIRKVISDHGRIIRAGCYVPTRGEVETKNTDWLYAVLIDWWWESPTELIPTDEQVSEVIAILRSRADADTPEIQRIIAGAPPPEWL